MKYTYNPESLFDQNFDPADHPRTVDEFESMLTEALGEPVTFERKATTTAVFYDDNGDRVDDSTAAWAQEVAEDVWYKWIS